MQAFPIKIPTLWRQTFPGLILGALVAQISSWARGEPFSLPNTLPLMGVAALMVVVMYVFQPTLCGTSGLKVMSIWGFRRSVTWTDVKEVNFARLFLIQPSLKLTDTHGRSHWIARDTKDLKGLYALAKKYGGPNHPLTLALETPLFQL